MRKFFLGILFFAIVVAGYYFFIPTEKQTEFVSIPAEKKEPVFEPNVARRNVTPENVLPAPKVESETLERLPAIVSPPPPPKPPEPKDWGNPIVLSAGVLKSGKTTVLLKDITPVPLGKKCVFEDGTRWPCGMFARTEMRQFVRRRPMDCDPIEDETALKISTRCRLGNFDMSAWLVLTGWAEPKGDFFKDELNEAKEKNRGQWRLSAP